MTRRAIAAAAILVLVACGRSQSLSGKQQADLEAIVNGMLAAGATAESVTGGYSTVWSRAIQSGSDFNVELASHRTSPEVKAEIDKLDQQFASLEVSIRQFHADGGPDTVFQQIGDAYELLARFRMLANSPSGSLQSFNATVGELSNRTVGAVSRLRLYLATTVAAVK